MDTQTYFYIGAGVGGIIIGVIATHYIEKLIFKRGMKKMQSAWRHESRVRGLEPARTYLDKLTLLIGASEQQAIIARTSKKGNDELNQLIVDNFLKVQAAESGTDFSVGDPLLIELLKTLHLDNKEHVIFMNPNLWFSPTFKNRVHEAYNRIDILSTEL